MSIISSNNKSLPFFVRLFLVLQSYLSKFRKVKKQDNVISSVHKLVRYYHIKVSLAAISEFLKSHKDYPSLKSICDFFNEINIEHHPLRVELKDLYYIRSPFLVHLNVKRGRVIVVYKITKKFVIYSDSVFGKKVIRIQEFLDKWEGVIIVIQPSKESSPWRYRIQWEENIIDKSLLAILISVLILTGFGNRFNLYGIEYGNGLMVPVLLFHTTGLLFSILLVRNEMNIKTQITEKLCHFSTMTDCDAIAASKASKLFGYITWADIGVAWFTGGVVLMINAKESLVFNMLGIFSVISLPYPVFSILYQKFKIRKWCPLCLLVQAVLIAEFLLLFKLIEINNIHIVEITFFVVTFITVLTIILLIKRNILLKREKNELKLELTRMKRDPEIFINRLLSGEKVVIPNAEPTFSFGKSDEKVTINVFLSLLCSACASMFTEVMGITRILRNVRIQIIIYPVRNEITLELFRKLDISLKDGKMENAAMILTEWYSMKPGSRARLYTNYSSEGQVENACPLIERSRLFFETCNITRVPAIFVNGYPLPGYYKVEDLKYLLNDTDIFLNEHEYESIKRS